MISQYSPKDLRNNKLHEDDRAFHDWYRFVLSFPPHLVRHYFDYFGLSCGSVVLDPFCGTGTTVVEAKKNNITAYGIEAIPLSSFSAQVKTNWDVNTDQLRSTSEQVLEKAERFSRKSKILLTLSQEENDILLTNSISPVPLHKCLALKKAIDEVDKTDIRSVLLLALAHVAVSSASNLKFGPEVGVQRKKKEDSPVLEDYALKVETIIKDLMTVQIGGARTQLVCGDSRCLNGEIKENSIDAVITSPPYPNEKDYTRTTRLESVLLGFLSSKKDLRSQKESLLRSNTRNVYVNDKEDNLIKPNGSIDRIAQEIERRRIALNKTSGFEKLYHRVTRLYFGGMTQHLITLQKYMKPGAKLAYVVGDQASYLRVLIRTGELLAEIANEIGYKVLDLELFRTRVSTATGQQLREEVLILEWTGNNDKGRKMTKSKNRYDALIEDVFFNNYKKDDREVVFSRSEFEPLAKKLKIQLPKNLGDIIYSYRYRNPLPKKMTNLLQEGEEWIIRSIGRGKYQFAKSAIHRIMPNPRLSKIKILDATPEIIRRYALNDEQALLAILRYNRLIDVFLGLTCYPLQSHLRTTVPNMGQVETDELYIGINTKGSQYVIPVQAKGQKDDLGIVQIEQDFAICETKFPNLICRSIAAQFVESDLIALFEFEKSGNQITIKEERHYQVVPNEDLSEKEIHKYNLHD